MGGKKLAKSKKKKDNEVEDKQEAQAEVEATEQQEPKPEEQTAAEETAGLPHIDVYSLLRYFIGLLGTYAWQWMGLMKDPVTGQMEKDLAQAKIAIDSIRTLMTQLENKMDESERRELKDLIGNLQINFVQQSAREP